MKLTMTKVVFTLLEGVDSSFSEISYKLDECRVKLQRSMSGFETGKYVENLIKSLMLLKEHSLELDKTLRA
jgi:hypothetical protein